MMHKIQSLLLILVGGLLFGCTGIFHQRDMDYLNAKNVPSLKMPQGLHSAREDYYPIPPKNFPEQTKNISLVPPELYKKQ